MSEIQRPCAAVAYIRNEEGKILVVWNKRYGRWAMPGGKVEEDEDPVEAVAREVGEETWTEVVSAKLIFEGAHGEKVETTRGSWVYVFDCIIRGTPREIEPGCPVTWFTREEFLKWGLAPALYERMFKEIS